MDTTCQCKEMTCTKDCKENHTHKGFFCEICEPEAVSKMRTAAPPTVPTEEWEEGFRVYEEWFKLMDRATRLFNAPSECLQTRDNIKNFIRSTRQQAYEQGMREVVEKFRSEIEKQIDNKGCGTHGQDYISTCLQCNRLAYSNSTFEFMLKHLATITDSK